MDGVDRMERRKSLKERLGLKNMSCCGAAWSLRPTTMSVRDDDEAIDDYPLDPQIVAAAALTPPEGETSPACLEQLPARSGMNLAAALAAERNMRAVPDTDSGGAAQSPSPSGPNAPNHNGSSSTVETVPGTPLRVSLMRLLEETDSCDREAKKEEEADEENGGACGGAGGGVGNDSVCCVCMGRKKGAAFIPCGHTFCRVCSRELWLNRGTCPLCNRSINEVLDIF